MTESNLNFMKNEYMASLKGRSYSQNTIDSYQVDLEQFLAFIEKNLKIMDIKDITTEMIGLYQSYLFYHTDGKGKKYSINTQSHKLIVVKTFFKWLKKTNRIVLSPTSKMELPKQEEKLGRKPLSMEELEKFYRAIDVKTFMGFRDYTIFTLFYTTAIRATELINIELDDLNMETGMLRIRKGKGNKERFVPVIKGVQKQLNIYLEVIRPQIIKGSESSALFVSRMKKRFESRLELNHLAKKYSKLAGLDRQIGCHHFRVTCATHLMESGADLRQIQELLGHSKMSTLEHYLKVSIKNLKEVHNQKHPREKETEE